MIVGIDNDKLEFIATDDGQLVVTLRNLTEAIADREEFLNAFVTHCKDCHWHYGTICRRDSTFPWEDDDYCSKAEREEYETD